MQTHELVMRSNGTNYLRRIPHGRKFEDATENRKQAIHQFTKSAVSGRSKNYEEYIEHMRIEIKPVGRTPRYRKIKLTDEDIEAIHDRLVRENINSIELSKNHILRRPTVRAIVDELKIEKAVEDNKLSITL